MRVSVLAIQAESHRVALAPVWEHCVRSARYSDTEYLVRLLPDGSWTCTCSAYSYGSRLDGECRHIDIAREERERQRTLAFLLVLGVGTGVSKRKSRQQAVHTAVYHRAAWQCQMPKCLCPDGRKIDKSLRGTNGPWAPSIDHIKTLATGGPDRMENMRSAHRECNRAGAEDQQNVAKARPVPPPLSVTIGDLFPDLALLGKRDPEL